MVASQNGHVEVVDKLLQHGAKADLQEKVSGVQLIVSPHMFHDLEVCLVYCSSLYWHLRMDMLKWSTSYYNMEQKQTYRKT